MSTVYGDAETCSRCNLKNCGAHIYAADPTTDVIYLCFAVDDGPVETWRPGNPVPAPFVAPAEHMFVFDNWTFEQLILGHVLVPRYGFAPIPIENMDCAQRRALASAFPAELGLRCEALGLPYRKDPEARRAMLRLARMQEYKQPAARDRDLDLLLQRCRADVEATRAAYNSPRLRPLLPEERQQLLLDAKINARGVCANVPFLKAVGALTIKERDTINARLAELTDGAVTSLDQVSRIMETVNANGHKMKTLGKRSVAATLAHDPDDLVRELLELRQRGAFASTRKFKTLLDRAGPGDTRIRGALRIYGAGPGRWSSLGAQLHNLMRNDAELPASLVDALIASNHAELARFGNPLKVVGQLSRAALCAAPGHELICADFGAIESRITAWLAGEEWKLENFRRFDATGDKALDSYRVTAHRILKRTTAVSAISAAERQLGKCAELACGFGGALGAWRRIANDEDARSDAEVQAIIRGWRNAHPKTCAFWQRLMRAARISIRTKQAIRVMPAPRPSIITDFDGTDFTITLPSGRAITYPGARLTPNTKFENGESDIEFFDNAHKQWKPVRAWFGMLVENVVQGTARDLLATAIIRAEARGWQVVHHCHDELVIEAPIGAIPEKDVLTLLLEPPEWAAGLPLGGKVHSGPLYLEAPATAEPPVKPGHHVAPARTAREAPKFINDFDSEPDFAPAAKDRSVTADGKIHCPFPDHPDKTPSLQLWADGHYHCFGCGAHGWIDEDLDIGAAELAKLADEKQDNKEKNRARALRLWGQAVPIPGTIGARYLSDARGIDLAALPPTIDQVLRYHPHCPFNGVRHPCLVALMRNPTTDDPTGIHRIALTPEGRKIERRMLGASGAVKLWPAGETLVIGEGLETVLAAATRLSYHDEPLQPAWSALADGPLRRLPLVPGVKRLIVLADNDLNGVGQAAAHAVAERYRHAGRTSILLLPEHAGEDFNDLIGRPA